MPLAHRTEKGILESFGTAFARAGSDVRANQISFYHGHHDGEMGFAKRSTDGYYVAGDGAGSSPLERRPDSR